MPALSWLMNLGFAGGGVVAPFVPVNIPDVPIYGTMLSTVNNLFMNIKVRKKQTEHIVVRMTKPSASDNYDSLFATFRGKKYSTYSESDDVYKLDKMVGFVNVEVKDRLRKNTVTYTPRVKHVAVSDKYLINSKSKDTKFVFVNFAKVPQIESYMPSIEKRNPAVNIDFVSNLEHKQRMKYKRIQDKTYNA